MVHTDGIRTIANASAPAFEVVAEITVDVLDTPLLERSSSSETVTLHYSAGHCVLRVEDGQGTHEALVASANALDAFNHPYIYLAQ